MGRKAKVVDPDIILKHTPPHNYNAEQAVLGGIFLRASIFEEMACSLKPEDFYTPAHRNIFCAAITVANRSEPVDLVTVATQMQADGTLEESGGPVYLAELAASPVSAANAAYHAKIMLECSRRRELATAGATVLAGAYDMSTPLDWVESSLAAPLDTAKTGGEVISAADSVRATMPFIEKCMVGAGRGLGIPTPWERLTLTLSGWAPSAVHYLGARPGLGKTAMALQAARHAAYEGSPVLIFSMEMPHDQLTCRNIASMAKVNGQRLRGVGRWEEEEMARVYSAADSLSKIPLYVYDRPGLTPTRLLAVARRYVRRFGVKLIIVDYFQRMRGDDPRMSPREQFTDISRRIKDTALELSIPFLVLAQLNRAADLQGAGHEPKMHHLKETGAAEEDADAVMLLWSAMKDTDTAKEIFMRMAKNRNGPEGGLFSFRFNKQHLYFSAIEGGRE